MGFVGGVRRLGVTDVKNASDFNLSGEIESDDVLAFADLYAAGDERADINEDASLDATDGAIALDLISKGLP